MALAAYDIYLDLGSGAVAQSELERLVAITQRRADLRQGQRLTASSGSNSVIGISEQRWAVPAGQLPLGHALSLAELDGRGLFVIRGRWFPPRHSLDAIADLANLDPNIGTVQPRFQVRQPGELIALGSPSAAELDTISTSLAGLLPDRYVTPEIDSACVFITPQAVPAGSFLPADQWNGELCSLLIALRRKGLRNLVTNRSVVDYPLDPTSAYPLRELGSDAADADDYAQGREWLARSSFVYLEQMLAGAVRDGKKRLLLDCRGMTATHNGSAHAIVGYLTGVAQNPRPDWEVTVCVGRNAAQFHRLETRFPEFEFAYEVAGEGYLVAIHLTQPWSMDMMVELHEAAPLVCFNILDTIAWDAIYPAPDTLDGVTAFAAAWSDGLMYLSQHSRDRFRFRFAPHARMREAVTYLSTTPVDYASAGSAHGTSDITLLVVGNRLDHKDVDRTAAKLSEAFPFERIVAFGTGTELAHANVESIPSGFVDDASVRDLYERAVVVVFPSFSEGFGIPVVHALSLGKPVVARELPLWDEIRERMGAHGRLTTFRTDSDLVEAVGRALEAAKAGGPPVEASAATVTWSDCGRVLLDFAQDVVDHFAYDHWQARDLSINLPFA